MIYHVPRVGLVLGSVSATFYILMCMHRRGKFLKSKRGQAIFLAAMISAIPLMGLRKNEQSLLKLLIYPVAWRCFCTTLLENQIIPTINRHGDILAYVALSSVIGYCMVFEAWSSPMNKAVTTYAQFDGSILKYMQAVKTTLRISVNECF